MCVWRELSLGGGAIQGAHGIVLLMAKFSIVQYSCHQIHVNYMCSCVRFAADHVELHNSLGQSPGPRSSQFKRLGSLMLATVAINI